MNSPVQTTSRSSTAYFSLGPSGLVFAVALIAMIILLSPDGLLAGSALILLLLMARLVWRLGELPVLFLALGVQWTQIATPILRGAFEGQALSDQPLGVHLETAIWLSLLGLLAVALGMRLAIVGLNPTLFAHLRTELSAIRPGRIWGAYFITLFVTPMLESLAWQAPRVAQIVYSLTGFKWALLYIAALLVFTRKQGYLILILAIGFETLNGLLDFFSEYRRVYFVLLLALVSAERRLSRQAVVAGLTTVTLLLFLSCFWTAIKVEYRDFLNRGTGRQAVYAPLSERFDKLFELTVATDADTLGKAFTSLLDRIAYVEFFARVVHRVPEILPHSDGELWGAAIRHVANPRVFFPDKPNLTPDVLLTERYTGLTIVAQAGRHTEVPLGYMAETYIDFGPIWMALPLFCVGLALGLMYRYFLSRREHLVFGYGFALITVSAAFSVESSVVKLTGGVLMTFLTMALCHKFVVPHVYRILVGAPKSQRRR